MEYRSSEVAAPGLAAGGAPAPRVKADWRLAGDAHAELHIVGIRRTNLLLMGTAGAIRMALEILWPELREPIVSWHPGQRLDLPSPGRTATLILHNLSEMTFEDQHRLLRWLDLTRGRTRVISTTAEPLWPLVTSGAFNEVLYYRVNTMCVDVAV